MGIVVQKFGGTSLRSKSSYSHILSHVKKTIDEGDSLVLVVSAIGRKGEPYSTDTLIHLMEIISTDIDPKKKDLIMSCGEVISATIISHLLDTEDIPSEPLTGFQAGILTDNNFTNSKILDINISNIQKHLKENKIVVVAGFQGATKDMEITTLGRGGSDTTAVALGGYLNAKRVDIFTDVPGVALIDPNIVPTTQFIQNITYDDMYNLSAAGATVIHPRAVLTGKSFNIPIRVLSTYEDLPGTLISNIEKTSTGKLIGIAIKRKQDRGIISIFFKKGNKCEIKSNVEKFIDNDKILEATWTESKLVIVVDPTDVDLYSKNLYELYKI